MSFGSGNVPALALTFQSCQIMKFPETVSRKSHLLGLWEATGRGREKGSVCTSASPHARAGCPPHRRARTSPRGGGSEPGSLATREGFFSLCLALSGHLCQPTGVLRGRRGGPLRGTGRYLAGPEPRWQFLASQASGSMPRPWGVVLLGPRVARNTPKPSRAPGAGRGGGGFGGLQGWQVKTGIRVKFPSLHAQWVPTSPLSPL